MIKVAVLDDYQNIFQEIIDVNNFKKMILIFMYLIILLIMSKKLSTL